MIQNGNIENPSQKLILLSGNMFDYIVRLLVWAVEGGDKVSKHPVLCLQSLRFYPYRIKLVHSMKPEDGPARVYFTETMLENVAEGT